MKRLAGVGVVVALIATGVLTAIPAGAANQTVTCTLSPPTVNIGQTAHITGSVSPAAPGKQIRLQRLIGSAWHPYKWKYLTSSSTYDFGVREDVPGYYEFRVASPHGVCRGVTLAVYANQYLSDIPPVDNNVWSLFGDHSADCSSVRTINGILYPHACLFHSFWNDASGAYTVYADWNLKRACSTFTATIGLDDNDSNIAQVQLTISNELGTTLYQHTYGLGQAVPISLNISGDLQLKFFTLGVNSMDPNDEPIDVGNPQIRCTWLQPAS